MSKHTPKPWEACVWDFQSKDDFLATCAEQWDNTLAHGDSVAMFHWVHGHDPDEVSVAVCGMGPCSEANANLIAAAPDLLDVCKDVVKHEMAHNDVVDWDFVERAKAVIAKAEGQRR